MNLAESVRVEEHATTVLEFANAMQGFMGQLAINRRYYFKLYGLEFVCF